MGVICQIYCDPFINCSGHGQCYAEYEGLSMNTSVGCHCEQGYRQTWENGYLECIGVPYYTYQMPWGFFYFLVVGVPFLSIVCCVSCVFYYLTSRQVAITKKMQGDIEGFVNDYEQENEDFAIDKTEINADLCMPMVGHIDEDNDEEQEHLQVELPEGLHEALPVNDTEGQRARLHRHSRSEAPSSSDGTIGAPTRLLQIVPAGEEIPDNVVADEEEDWRKYLVNTALNRRLRAVHGYMNSGPRKDGDDGGGDEVAV